MSLDVEKIMNEKEKLQAIVQLAVEQFVKETGLTPHIEVGSLSNETKCGITSNLRVVVKAII